MNNYTDTFLDITLRECNCADHFRWDYGCGKIIRRKELFENVPYSINELGVGGETTIFNNFSGFNEFIGGKKVLLVKADNNEKVCTFGRSWCIGNNTSKPLRNITVRVVRLYNVEISKEDPKCTI